MVQTCIYCRSTTGPFTGEHVLGRSLGGNLKIKDVCDICNNQRLSKIDQALAERSTISLPRLVRTPTTQPVRLGGEHFIEESGLDIEVRVGNELDVRALPQIHAPLPFTPERTTLTTHCDSWPAFDAFVKLVELRIADRTLQKTRIFASGTRTLRSISLVQRQSNELAVRAETEEQGRTFLDWLQKHWRQYITQRSRERATTQPLGTTLRMEVAHRPDDYQRAIAKTALNYLAFANGSEFALRPELDPLRAYVLGQNLQVDHAAVAAGDVAHDSRFVRMLDTDAGLVPTESHVVLLGTVERELLALITFYGRVHYLVRMGTLADGEEVIARHEFSVDRSSNQALPINVIVRRILEAMRRR